MMTGNFQWSDPKVLAAAAASIGIATIGFLFLRKKKKNKPTDRKPGVVYLHQFPRATFSPNPSPFCVKLEFFLRMAGIPYEVSKSMSFGTKGKMPWIEYNGETVTDSTFCIDFLQKEKKVDVDAKLSEEEKAQALAIKTMCEEHFHWALVYSRWIDTPMPRLMELLRFNIPFPISTIVGWRLKSVIGGYLHGQGMGRHSRDEIYELAARDIRAIATLLGNKKYMMGNELTSVDATVFAYMSQSVWDPVKSPMMEEATKHENIVGYVERVKAKIFPDWDKICV